MIRCPNCGSTAQVKFDDYIDDFCGFIQAHYVCDCGAKFHFNYEVKGEVVIDVQKDSELL